ACLAAVRGEGSSYNLSGLAGWDDEEEKKVTVPGWQLAGFKSEAEAEAYKAAPQYAFLGDDGRSRNPCARTVVAVPMLKESDLNHLFRRSRACERGSGTGPHRGNAERISLIEIQHAEFGLADAHRVLQHGLKHGLKLTGRAGNDLQDLGSRGLLLQRFP